MRSDEYDLVCLAEELNEVSKACSTAAERVFKALRFTAEEIQPGQLQTNMERIVAELADVRAMIELLEEKGLITRKMIDEKKTAKYPRFLRYATECGAVDKAPEPEPEAQAEDATVYNYSGSFYLTGHENFPLLFSGITLHPSPHGNLFTVDELIGPEPVRAFVEERLRQTEATTVWFRRHDTGDLLKLEDARCVSIGWTAKAEDMAITHDIVLQTSSLLVLCNTPEPELKKSDPNEDSMEIATSLNGPGGIQITNGFVRYKRVRVYNENNERLLWVFEDTYGSKRDMTYLQERFIRSKEEPRALRLVLQPGELFSLAPFEYQWGSAIYPSTDPNVQEHRLDKFAVSTAVIALPPPDAEPTTPPDKLVATVLNSPGKIYPENGNVAFLAYEDLTVTKDNDQLVWTFSEVSGKRRLMDALTQRFTASEKSKSITLEIETNAGDRHKLPGISLRSHTDLDHDAEKNHSRLARFHLTTAVHRLPQVKPAAAYVLVFNGQEYPIGDYKPIIDNGDLFTCHIGDVKLPKVERDLLTACLTDAVAYPFGIREGDNGVLCASATVYLQNWEGTQAPDGTWIITFVIAATPLEETDAGELYRKPAEVTPKLDTSKGWPVNPSVDFVAELYTPVGQLLAECYPKRLAQPGPRPAHDGIRFAGAIYPCKMIEVTPGYKRAHKLQYHEAQFTTAAWTNIRKFLTKTRTRSNLFRFQVAGCPGLWAQRSVRLYQSTVISRDEEAGIVTVTFSTVSQYHVCPYPTENEEKTVPELEPNSNFAIQATMGCKADLWKNVFVFNGKPYKFENFLYGSDALPEPNKEYTIDKLHIPSLVFEELKRACMSVVTAPSYPFAIHCQRYPDYWTQRAPRLVHSVRYPDDKHGNMVLTLSFDSGSPGRTCKTPDFEMGLATINLFPAPGEAVEEAQPTATGNFIVYKGKEYPFGTFGFEANKLPKGGETYTLYNLCVPVKAYNKLWDTLTYGPDDSRYPFALKLATHHSYYGQPKPVILSTVRLPDDENGNVRATWTLRSDHGYTQCATPLLPKEEPKPVILRPDTNHIVYDGEIYLFESLRPKRPGIPKAHDNFTLTSLRIKKLAWDVLRNTLASPILAREEGYPFYVHDEDSKGYWAAHAKLVDLAYVHDQPDEDGYVTLNVVLNAPVGTEHCAEPELNP